MTGVKTLSLFTFTIGRSAIHSIQFYDTTVLCNIKLFVSLHCAGSCFSNWKSKYTKSFIIISISLCVCTRITKKEESTARKKIESLKRKEKQFIFQPSSLLACVESTKAHTIISLCMDASKSMRACMNLILFSIPSQAWVLRTKPVLLALEPSRAKVKVKPNPLNSLSITFTFNLA